MLRSTPKTVGGLSRINPNLGDDVVVRNSVPSGKRNDNIPRVRQRQAGTVFRFVSKEVWINPNREGRAIEGAQLSTELVRVVRVSENPGDKIRIHPNQEAVSAMTDDWCQDEVMLCVKAHKVLQADCPTEGELATSSNVEPNTLRAGLAVVSDSPVKAVMPASLETAWARMNPNQGPMNMSLPDESLETTVIRIHLRHTDEGLQLAGIEGCRLLTTLDKDNSADDWIDPTLSDVRMELPAQPGYDDPLYSALHNEAVVEEVLKKASDTVGDRFLYLSDDDIHTLSVTLCVSVSVYVPVSVSVSLSISLPRSFYLCQLCLDRSEATHSRDTPDGS
ncbi:hypothetical protein CBR_g54787 [Chara braunii]|uniref:Uncharacterized protein n=1 Tax=Chara braunii TaxID=69332 RepID=A0A388MCK7_CHABU|nr:hypothetical protein CBR_g54787 [Chara braunii]|eukprot:GBG92243.1 hypothetical protein CBR_g54787 [Chara braunii]